MSDEMVFEGKSYVSSKRAAVLSGYAQDYIGQLARSGQIEARRVGGLWYILPNSLNSYKENAEQYVPVPPQREYSAPEHEVSVSFEGKEYVSSVRAAKLTGYNQDYIGQLARLQRVLSRQVGNRWYIDRESLLSHKKEKDGLLGAVQAQSVGLVHPARSDISERQASHNDELFFNYISDSAELIPTIPTKYDREVPELANEHLLDLHKHDSSIPITRIKTHGTATSHTTARYHAPAYQPEVRTRKRTSADLKTVAAGLLTIVIVLSVSFATLKSPGIYAFVGKSMPAKLDTRQLSASAVQAYQKAGDLLEGWFVPQRVYHRQD